VLLLLLLLWDSWDCGTCWDVVGVGEGVGFGRANHECPDNVNVTPCAVCPLLAFFLAPWRIASQKQKLLLASSQFVFPLWCRRFGGPPHIPFYLYSSAVVILLHEDGAAAAKLTFCPHLWTL